MLRKITAESIFDIYNIESPRISPDGKMVSFVRSRPDEKSDSYERSIWFAETEGKVSPFPFINTGLKNYAPDWSPDGKDLVFISTRDGSPQLYRIPVGGGEAVKLTSMVGGVASPSWSPDGSKIVFNSESTLGEHQLEDDGLLYNSVTSAYKNTWSEKHCADLKDPRVIEKLPYKTGQDFFDGRYSHLYYYDCNDGSVKRLSNGNFHHSPGQWSADSKLVVANSNREQKSGDEFFELWSSILSFSVETGKMKVIKEEVCEEGRPPRISPDGKWVAYFYVPKSPSPYQAAYFVAISSLDGGEIIKISDEDMTIADFKWDHDSKHILLNIHTQGDAVIKRVNINDPEKKAVVVLDGKRFVSDLDVAKDGSSLVYSVTRPEKPSDLFICKNNGKDELQLTSFNDEWEAAHFRSKHIEINYKAADGTDVQGWYCKPMNFDPTKKYPLAVEIHGGPQVMWGNSFFHEMQMLASHGYFVFMCNPRGSSGYGLHFQEIRENGGNTDMPDIMTGMDEVIKMESSIDPEKLVVTGGSYGGFLSGWIVTHTDRFKAVVSQRGVYDELNMFGSGDIPESVEWYFDGVPRKENLLNIWEHSPIAHAANVTTPLMILHSENDFRVPVAQAESFFAHLRRQGKTDTVMVRYPDEGHELSRSGGPLHRVDRLYKIMGWFDLHISKDPEDFTSSVKSILGEGWSLSGDEFVKTYNTGNYIFGGELLKDCISMAERYKVKPEYHLSENTLKISLSNLSIKNLNFVQRVDKVIG